MFSDYQMQEMSENFIDSFGFQDDEFTDSDMNIRFVNHCTGLHLMYMALTNIVVAEA